MVIRYVAIRIDLLKANSFKKNNSQQSKEMDFTTQR